MSRNLRAVAAAAVGTLVLAAPAVAAAPPQKVGTKINVQNASIGQLKLGQPASKARSLLGRADDQNSKGFSGKSSSLTLSYQRYGLSLIFWRGTQGGSPKLATIVVSSSQYKANGVGVGSSVTAVQGALGRKLQCFSKSKGIKAPFCQYVRRSGDVTFDVSGSRVSSIRIGS
jgi:hypothetical protein